MKKTPLIKRGFTSLFLILIFSAVGFEIFQGQKTIEVPINEKMFDYDESDPNIDRVTREAFSHVVAQTDEDLDIITDANGFDNFEIGVDFAEQMLVSNPRNPLNMQFGVNSSAGQNAYYTTDGYNWTSSNPSYHASTCCDPWSAFDSLGRLTYGSGVSGQYIYRSSNGGATYGPPILSVSGNDRNTLAADQTNGPYSNYLYAAITPGNFSRSINNGLNWTQTYAPSNTIPGTMIAVGPNGNTQGGCVMYVTNTGSTQNVTYTFHRSLDGGQTFSVRSSLAVAGYVGTLNSVGRLVINNGRTRPYPMIAMDNSYGPKRGRLYLVYASNVPAGNGNKPDIILQYSDDQGATWSNKITVNDNANPQLSDQWFPAIWCEKETGRLYIKWYDTRENPATYAVNVYATYTDDGGATFAPNQKLTTQSWTYPNPACSPNTNCYRGDYDGMTANTKTGFAVWYDGRSGTYKNVASYIPDFGLTVTPASQTINQTNDSRNFSVNIPAVKLYTDVTTFSAAVSPVPPAGTIEFEFLGGNTLSSYPNTKYMKVKTVGTVTAGNYNVIITGQGSNGTPVHKRTVTVTVNSSVSAAPCDDFSGEKFPPASMFEEYSGTNYWSRSAVSAYGSGAGSARFEFYSANLGVVQSIVSNNFAAAGADTYLTFDEAYAPYNVSTFGPDTLVVEVSNNSGNSYTALATLTGRYDGTGELNTAPPQGVSYTPGNSEWRPKIYLLPVGTNKIRLKAKSGYGNNLYLDNICVQSLPTAIESNIGLINEAMFIPTNPYWRLLDTVTVYLHRTDFPNVVVDSSKGVAGFNAVVQDLFFNRALNGTYYRVVKHRNSLETWSNIGVAYIRGSSSQHNFVPDNASYGNNMATVSVSPLYKGQYSGDIDQNGLIDLADVIGISNDASNFVTGYVVSDLDGNYVTDLTDLLYAYNNAAAFVVVVRPPGAEPLPEPVETDMRKIPVTFENEAQKQKYELGLNQMQIQENEVKGKYIPNWGVDEKNAERLRKVKKEKQNSMYKDQNFNNVGKK